MYVKVPTGFTFSDIRAGVEDYLPAFNSWLTSKGISTVVVGSQNPMVLALNDFDMGGASWVRGTDMADLAVCGPISNISHFPMYYVELITGINGDVEQMPVFFEFSNESDLDAEVPSGFPDRTYDTNNDPEGDPDIQVHTWRTWSPSHEIVELGGKWYKSSETAQEAIPASCWIDESTAEVDPLVVKTVSEYRKIQAENSGE